MRYKNTDQTKLLVPITPLDLLYKSLRKMQGSREILFEGLLARLKDRHGPQEAHFLAELFRRSVSHASFYSNIDQNFHPNRKGRKEQKNFANLLVEQLPRDRFVQVKADGFSFKLVDHEIWPFRTTSSCRENGTPAKAKGKKRIDLLLACEMSKKTIPAVGEVKARTESVGPTFALIQALLYASQLGTSNQFKRLKKHYPDHFGNIDPVSPRVDIVVIMETGDRSMSTEDYGYAKKLARDILPLLKEHLRAITFLSCSNSGENSFKIESSELLMIAESREGNSVIAL